MEEPKNAAHRGEEEKNPIIVFFANLLAGIKLPFVQEKNGAAASEPAVEISKVEEPVKMVEISKVEDETPSVVTFPRQSFEPVKLEAEADDGQKSTNPMLLWQVYAIGGFLVLRWGWTRWNERKGKKKSEDEPPPTQD
ncbi:hypothetical protein ACS0TY_009480 [Phlomoides rotata]